MTACNSREECPAQEKLSLKSSSNNNQLPERFILTVYQVVARPVQGSFLSVRTDDTKIKYQLKSLRTRIFVLHETKAQAKIE